MPAAAVTPHLRPVTSLFVSNGMLPGRGRRRWSLTLIIMSSPHGIWRVTQGKRIVKYHILTLLNTDLCGGVVLVCRKWWMIPVFRLKSTKRFAARYLLCFWEEHSSLWCSASPWRNIKKQVVCGVVCQLYGTETEYKRHKSRDRHCYQVAGVFLSNVHNWTYTHPKARWALCCGCVWQGGVFTVNTHSHCSPTECKHKINPAWQEPYDSFTGVLSTFLRLSQLFTP